MFHLTSHLIPPQRYTDATDIPDLIPYDPTAVAKQIHDRIINSLLYRGTMLCMCDTMLGNTRISLNGERLKLCAVMDPYATEQNIYDDVMDPFSFCHLLKMFI